MNKLFGSVFTLVGVATVGYLTYKGFQQCKKEEWKDFKDFFDEDFDFDDYQEETKEESEINPVKEEPGISDK